MSSRKMNMLIKPKWYRMLPAHVKPDSAKIKALEQLRLRLYLSHEMFMREIGVSRWAVIKAQEATLKRLKETMPNATDKELWRGVLFSRYEVMLKFPSVFDPPPNVIMQNMQNIDNVMKDINSFQDLIDYIVNMQKSDLFDGLDDDEEQRELNDILFQ